MFFVPSLMSIPSERQPFGAALLRIATSHASERGLVQLKSPPRVGTIS